MNKTWKLRKLPGPAGSIGFGAAKQSGNESADNVDYNFSVPVEHDLASKWSAVIESIFGCDCEEDQPCPRTLLATIDDINAGLHDLRVAHVVVFIDELTRSIDGSYSLKLKDPTGEILGFISKAQWMSIEKLGSPVKIQKGAVLYLQKVSIFVQKIPFARFLSVHSNNIRNIYLSP